MSEQTEKIPPTQKAKSAGFCYHCGNVFYVGDNIKVFVTRTAAPESEWKTAAHEKCFSDNYNPNPAR